MSPLYRHAWVLFIVVTVANGAIWWWRGRAEILRDPSLADGYQTLIRGGLVFGNVPWLVMGAGVVVGGVPSVFHYFNPENGPWVVFWYITVVVLWILFAYWIYLRGGAETLLRYPGLLNIRSREPWVLKTLIALMLMGGIAGLAAMVFGDIEVPG